VAGRRLPGDDDPRPCLAGRQPESPLGHVTRRDEPSWYDGRYAVATVLGGWPHSVCKRWRVLLTGANGQLAVAGYL
jgi:hypothetical protein